MYLVGDSFHVSFKWVVIISTKQEAAHTQSAKVSTCYTLRHFEDWSLITGREATMRQRWGGGGQVKFYPYKNGGGGSFSCAEGGAQQVLRIECTGLMALSAKLEYLQN